MHAEVLPLRAAGVAGAARAVPDLRRALRRANRRDALASLALILPLVAFLVVTFLIPVGALLLRSVDNPAVAGAFPATLERLQAWSGRDGVPPEPVFAALTGDLLGAAERQVLGSAAARLNQDYSGARSLLTATARRLQTAQAAPTGWRDVFTALDQRWGDVQLWAALKAAGERHTVGYYLHALDLTRDINGAVVARPSDQRIHVTLFLRTLTLSAGVAALCVLLGFPIAYLMARLPERRANLLMIMVLLPFWTSILVRIASWIVLLQREGVINQALVGLGLVASEARPALIYNMTGTVVVGTYVLLPFVVLPLYSVMRAIPPHLTRAAVSLGAHPFAAFRSVYLPLTVPGITAGSSLVFILAIGYFITPALVGGQSGQLISNVIAYHMQQSLNWGLAAALSTVLLLGISVLYAAYAALLRRIGRRA